MFSPLLLHFPIALTNVGEVVGYDPLRKSHHAALEDVIPSCSLPAIQAHTAMLESCSSLATALTCAGMQAKEGEGL